MDLAWVIQATHFSSSCLSSPLGPEASTGPVISCVWHRAKVPHSGMFTFVVPPLPTSHRSHAQGRQARGPRGSMAQCKLRGRWRFRVLRAVSLPHAYAVCSFCPWLSRQLEGCGCPPVLRVPVWGYISVLRCPPVLRAPGWGGAYISMLISLMIWEGLSGNRLQTEV